MGSGSEGDGRNYAAWTLALAYSAAEQDSLEKEVELLQRCLDAILKLERAHGFKSKELAHKGHLEDFRRSLASLAVFRTKERELKNRARAQLAKTQNELRLEGYRLDKDEGDL